MTRSLAILLIHPNENVLNAAENALKPKSHASIWPDEYDVSRGRTIEGDYTLSASIHFYDATERDNAKGELKAVNGILHTCEDGTEITRLKSWHDEAVHGVVPRKCEIEDVEIP